MAEIMKNNKLKAIAFYLPQFHCIPENDNAYGKGFTEWTNVKKAKPLFEGHNQPRIPLDENYYNLLDVNVMINQAKIAQMYGVYGFCYYHYWFKNGKKLLEKPIENMLHDKRVDIPFCLCWANENWSKRWDGGNNEIIMEQDYGKEKEWKNHLEYLVEYFKDSRYITINNAPLFIIYKPELMPNYKAWCSFMKKEIKKYGFDDIIIVVQYPKYYLNKYEREVFDYYITFEPAFTRLEEEVNERNKIVNMVFTMVKNTPLKSVLTNIYNRFTNKGKCNLQKRNYDEDWEKILQRDVSDKKLILGAFVDWDNTPRNSSGLTYVGVNSLKFEKYLRRLAEIVSKRKVKCIFINAWNEWAEGAYLEPDINNGFSYLEGLRKIVCSNEN